MWCGRGDLNPHGLPRQILSLVRLPISPLPHTAGRALHEPLWPVYWPLSPGAIGCGDTGTAEAEGTVRALPVCCARCFARRRAAKAEP